MMMVMMMMMMKMMKIMMMATMMMMMRMIMIKMMMMMMMMMIMMMMIVNNNGDVLHSFSNDPSSRNSRNSYLRNFFRNPIGHMSDFTNKVYFFYRKAINLHS